MIAFKIVPSFGMPDEEKKASTTRQKTTKKEIQKVSFDNRMTIPCMFLCCWHISRRALALPSHLSNVLATIHFSLAPALGVLVVYENEPAFSFTLKHSFY